jgi:hypothetical protein
MNTVGVWIAGGMTLTCEGQSAWRKICSSAILFNTYPTWTVWDWHQASVMSGCWLTAWAMACLMHGEDTEQQSGIFKTFVAEFFRTTVNQPTRMCYHFYEFLGFYSGCCSVLVFSVIQPCRTSIFCYFGGTYCLHLWGDWIKYRCMMKDPPKTYCGKQCDVPVGRHLMLPLPNVFW